MKEMVKRIDLLVQAALGRLNLPVVKFLIEHPADEKHGDYAVNVALALYGKLDPADRHYNNPRQLAKEITNELSKDLPIEIEKIEVAGPGFINFFLSNKFFTTSLNQLIELPDLGKNESLLGQKIMVEYTDPNPFKEFHIGHLYSNIVGESISRLLEFSGAEVYRADYFGDVGMHVGKTLWGLKQKLNEDNLNLDDLSNRPLQERINYLGQAYAKGATAYKEDEVATDEIRKLNRLIYIAAQEMWIKEKGIKPQVDYRQGEEIDQEELEEVYRLYTQGRSWSLAYFETIYQRLGTQFNGYFPESLAAEYGFPIVIKGLEQGVFDKSGETIIFPGEKFGLHTRVFINKLGLPTYEAKELGLAPWKYMEFNYDLSVVVTGNEINEYFKVLISALSQLKPELSKKHQHIGHGMVKLPEGKMSSRTGKIVTGESLLDRAKEEAGKLGGETEILDETLADQIGQAAVKYALLKQNIGLYVIFSFEESVSFEGNSGPYIQYTHARCRSVLIKAGETVGRIDNIFSLNTEEKNLLSWLYRFPEQTEAAARTFSPHLICNYLFELAQRYNTFYNQHSILGSEKKPVEPEERHLRLLLTTTTAQIIRNGLELLGISAPEKM